MSGSSESTVVSAADEMFTVRVSARVFNSKQFTRAELAVLLGCSPELVEAQLDMWWQNGDSVLDEVTSTTPNDYDDTELSYEVQS